MKEVILANETVRVLKSIKILGHIFDSKLNWYNKAVSAIEKANKAKQALWLISMYFSTDEMVKQHYFTANYTMGQKYG